MFPWQLHNSTPVYHFINWDTKKDFFFHLNPSTLSQKLGMNNKYD